MASIDRRGFIARAGAAAAAGAALGAAAIASADEAAVAGQAEDAGAQDAPQSADIVVVGEGVGGLTAGVRALEDGVGSVVIVEASRWIGGGSSFSAGAIHAYGMGKTREDYLRNTRYQSTSDLAVNSFLAIQGFMDWISGLGLPLELREASDADAVYGGSANDLPSLWMVGNDGSYGMTACEDFFQAYEDYFVAQGGQILHQVAGRHVVMDEGGNITGIVCTRPDGSQFTIQTTQVVLATGGWQNDEELKSRYLDPEAWQAGVMGTPYNTGSGLKMAVECGASLQGDFQNFAGNFMPALPARNWMEDAANYEEHGYDAEEGGKYFFGRELFSWSLPAGSILVNVDGKRFCDEGRFRHSSESDVARQRFATAHLICDAATWADFMDESRLELLTSDAFNAAYFEGATIEELADNMNAAGVDTYHVNKAQLVKTVEEYNEAAAAGAGADLDPERVSLPCQAIEEGPFYAFPIRNAIFVTFGGVAIDESARVLDAARRPIPGLYATSPCAGGMMHKYYAGSMAHAGVTGMWAADAAAEALRG